MKLINADEIHKRNMRDPAYRWAHYRTWLPNQLQIMRIRWQIRQGRRHPERRVSWDQVKKDLGL